MNYTKHKKYSNRQFHFLVSPALGEKLPNLFNLLFSEKKAVSLYCLSCKNCLDSFLRLIRTCAKARQQLQQLGEPQVCATALHFEFWSVLVNKSSNLALLVAQCQQANGHFRVRHYTPQLLAEASASLSCHGWPSDGLTGHYNQQGLRFVVYASCLSSLSMFNFRYSALKLSINESARPASLSGLGTVPLGSVNK
jgi:hypothetical protein